MVFDVDLSYPNNDVLEALATDKTAAKAAQWRKAVAHIGVTAFLLFKNVHSQLVEYIHVPLCETLLRSCSGEILS